MCQCWVIARKKCRKGGLFWGVFIDFIGVLCCNFKLLQQELIYFWGLNSEELHRTTEQCILIYNHVQFTAVGVC